MSEARMKISGAAVRSGGFYSGNRLFSGGRGSGGGSSIGLGMSFSRSGGIGMGSGLGLRAGGLGMGTGLGLGLSGAGSGLGLGLSGAGSGLGLGLSGASLALGGGLGLGGAGAGAAGSRLAGFRASVAPLRARLGGRSFKIGQYGYNPAFLTTTTTVDAGISPMPSLDPSLPSVDTVQVTRLKEKQELQTLNDKFADFIDKARTLEQENAILKAKISMFTHPEQGGPANTSILLTSAIGTYKTQIDTLTATKEAIIAEIEHYKGIIEDVQARYDEETNQTKTLEIDWTTLKEEVDNLYLTIFELQTNIVGLEDQINLSKQVYDAKVKEVRNIVTGSVKSAFSISVDNAAQARDLTSALQDVKAHYETLAQRSKQDALVSVQDSLSMITLTTQPSTQTLTSAKEDLRVYKLQIDSVQREIERLKALNAQLESQVDEAESHSSSHTQTYQDQVLNLKAQLDDIRKQITQYGQEYQELLASKMSLDVEITAYKKLLDSEELRLKSGGGVTVHMSKTTVTGGGGGGGAGLALGGGGGGLGLGAGGGLGLGAGGGLGLGAGGGLGLGAGGGLGLGAGGLGLGGSGLGLGGSGLGLNLGYGGMSGLNYSGGLSGGLGFSSGSGGSSYMSTSREYSRGYMSTSQSILS